LLGIFPKSWMWFFMKPFANPFGMKLINTLKYWSGFLSNNRTYKQGHAEFAFLLDYVPNWKFIYKPGSMIQYQCFLPKEKARDGFKEIFELCQKRNLVTWLAVFKKHKPDDYLLSHSLDGFSMAMDFPVTVSNKKDLWDLAYEMDEIVLKNNGKFYFAKDSTLRSEVVKKFIPKDKLKKFIELKKQHDPTSLFETELYRRLKSAFTS
jgi:decaprenylphospho-beta-D-ribofuranose 2-oxidase